MSAKCAYCRRDTIKALKTYKNDPLTRTRDHILPRSRGGLDTADNRVFACMRCNNLKADMLPYEWWLYMVANPYWWLRTDFERKMSRRLGAPIPVADSQYILKHGKKAYRAWVAIREVS